MNTKNLIIIAALLLTSSFSSKIKKNLAKHSDNLIVNGNFAVPAQNGGWHLYQNIQGWKAVSGEIEIGAYNLYNSNWPAGTQVCEIDGNKNDIVGQTVALKHHRRCHLAFDYASRSNVPQTSNGLAVSWNGVIVADLETTNDYKIHHWCGEVHGIAGDNDLSFIGKGSSDSLGTTFTNVVLECVDYEFYDHN